MEGKETRWNEGRRRMEAAPDLSARRGFRTEMKRILIIDDEPCVREVCSQYLSMVGYEVDALASADEALDAASSRPYDLVILDLRLPGADGLTVFGRLKSMIPEAKAVVISGSVDRYESELELARRNGLLGVLAKPFDLQDLSALVESAFENRQAA